MQMEGLGKASGIAGKAAMLMAEGEKYPGKGKKRRGEEGGMGWFI